MNTLVDPAERFTYDLPEALEASEPPEARGLTRDAVRMLITNKSDGSLIRSTLVWREGLTEWQPASAASELVGLFPPT